MNKEGVYAYKLENPINNDELGPSTNPMQTIHVQMRKTTNFQDHRPNIFTKNVDVQIPNQRINGKWTFKIMDQRLVLEVLLYKLQINKLMGNELSRSWTKNFY